MPATPAPATPADAPRGMFRSAAAALLRPSPSPPRLAIAAQAGIAMLLAVGVPAAFGHSELGLLASIGALSALYLAARSRHERLRRLPAVQVVLILAAAAGAATRGDPIAAPVVLVLVAVVAVVLGLGFGLGPPGALFPVLAAGVSARLTAPRSAGGDGLDPLYIVLWTVIGAALAYVVVTAPLVVPAVRRRDAARPIAPIRFALDGAARAVIMRVVVGAVIASLLASWLGLAHGYWVAMTVVAVLQTGRGRRLTGIRAVHRILGTLLGALVFVGIAAVIGLPLRGIALAVVLGVLQFAVELVIVRHYGVALAFVTPLALIIAESGGGGDPWTVAGTRVVDAAIGCAIALAVLGVDGLLTRRPSPARSRQPSTAQRET